ncbi:MAG: type II secretion system protein GspC [Myxococcota bacterium]
MATHAVGSFLGWQVMADAETPAATDKDKSKKLNDDGDDEKKKPKSTSNKYLPTAPDRRVETITKFNVFCPTCLPAEAQAEADAKPLPGDIDVEDLEFPDATRSQLPLALVATMEAEDPGISLATISSSTDGSTGVYAEGEDVMDGVNLLAVNLGIVYLRAGSRVEYLQISDEAPPPPKPKDAGFDAKPTDKKPGKHEIAGAADSINCQGMSCTVERKFVNQLLANPAQLTRQGNARPYARDDLKGFRLSRVKKGTVPRMLGLRSGDVITGINGQPLDSLDGAMKLYTKLRSASHLSVDLVRNRGGSRQQLRLDISII